MASKRSRFLPGLLFAMGVAQAQAQPTAPSQDAEPGRADTAESDQPDSDETEAPARPAGDPPLGPRAPDLAPQAPGAIAPKLPVYDLRRCLALAELNYPKIHEARAKLEQKRAQQWQSRTAPYSEFTITSGLAWVPAIRGTAVYSPDTDLPISSDMGIAWQAGIEGVVPLWTFGKILNTWDAADAQVRVGEHELRKEKNDLRLSVRRAYYGVQLARDALMLIDEALARIEKYVGRLEARVADGEGDEVELLKLKMYREELIARRSEATKQAAIGLGGLRFLTGVVTGLDVPNVPLERLGHHLAPLSRYLSAARVYRPEINMARAGVLAREALMRVERAKLFPDLGLGLSAKVANAGNITDQKNPFVKDTGHGRSVGFGLVLRYKVDFLPQSARLAQAQAQLEEQRATERYALGGVGFEVEQAFREAEDAQTRLEAFARATGYARQWLIQVQQGIDVGTYDDEEIVDPAREYALKKFAQISATLDFNMALARLAQATGWDAIALTDQ